MPLESCMILLDNSEYMRNGDYVPTRLEAQQDAANLLVGAKTQSHPESTVGVSAGTELLVSPTDDVGKILSALHGLEMRDNENDVTAAVQVASLALKHRRNKNGAQRIVLFVGTPLEDVESRALQKAGRQLKKNNVAIDVVALGELELNEPKLRELVDAANGGGRGSTADDGTQERTCHLVTIPAGVLPSDVLASSPVLAGAGAFAASAAAAAASAAAGGSGGMGGGGAADNPFAEYGGVDPNMDPELAMALRVSMEEERARQERAAAAAAAAQSSSSSESKDAEMTDANPTDSPAAATGGGGGAAAETPADGGASAAADMGLSEEEALLQQALAMSMNENEPASSDATGGAGGGENTKPAATTSGGEDAVAMEEDDQDDDAAMQMALQMSMQADSDQAAASSETKKEGQQQQFQDAAFVNELLGSMPGVDPNDPEIQRALSQAQQQQQGKKEGGDGDKKMEDDGKK